MEEIRTKDEALRSIQCWGPWEETKLEQWEEMYK